ncbi:hypothetical protein ACWF94_33750 [Streptomyces sp. NPDC055078]
MRSGDADGDRDHADMVDRADLTDRADRVGLADLTDRADRADRVGLAGPGDRAVEDELRVFLRRVTPDLPAPEGRLRQVRERIARRRRRVMGAAVFTVTALAFAGALLPPALRDTGTPPSRASAAPAASPVPTAPAGPGLVAFPEQGSLTLRLPERWHALALPESLEYKEMASGYVSTRRLAPYRLPCAKKPERCAPVGALGRGDVLLKLDYGREGDFAAQARKLEGRLAKEKFNHGYCDDVGAPTSYTTLIPGPELDSYVNVVVCAAPGTPSVLIDGVGAMLTSATFGGVGASPVPSPPRPSGTRSALVDPPPGVR